MPVPLPPLNDLQGSGTTPTSDAFRAAIGQLRTFISEKLGFSGSNSDAQTALGGGTVGKAVFVSNTADPALTALGGTTQGKNIFQVVDELSLAKLLGAGSIAANPANIKLIIGTNYQVQIGTTLVTTNGVGVATITFPEEFFAKTGQPVSAMFALVTLGDANAMAPIAVINSSYTSTAMQIQCAASVPLRVNWLAVATYPTIF